MINNNLLINEDKYNYVIKELQNYILDNDFFTPFRISNAQNVSIFQSKTISNVVVPNEKWVLETIKNPKPIFKKETDFLSQIKEKDSLFWIFYIIVFGEVKFEKLKPINLVKEKKIKIEFIEKCRLKKNILKSFKFASLVHIENQLLNEVKIDLNTFFSLCVLETQNVFYVNKKTFYELSFSPDNTPSSKILYLTKLENLNQFKFKIFEQDSNLLENYRKTLYKIDLFYKPIKAISNYKLQELMDFCLKLGLEIIKKETGLNKKKNELYEQLVQYF